MNGNPHKTFNFIFILKASLVNSYPRQLFIIINRKNVPFKIKSQLDIIITILYIYLTLSTRPNLDHERKRAYCSRPRSHCVILTSQQRQSEPKNTLEINSLSSGSLKCLLLSVILENLQKKLSTSRSLANTSNPSFHI